MTRLLGAVIAGGRSSRFGSDKGLALWRGTPLIDHVIAALRPVVDDLVVCGRGHTGMVTIADRPAPDMGPLGGLSGALHYARDAGFDAVLTAGCDTPVLPAPLLTRLTQSAGAALVDRLPVIGIWPVTLADALAAFLAEDRKHSIRIFARGVGAEALDWPELANINECADLERLADPAGQ